MMYRHPAGPKTLVRQPDTSPSGPYRRIELCPVGATIGAMVRGADLRLPLDDETFEEIDRALLEWKLLLFSDQHLTLDQHAAFAGRWGDIVDDQLLFSKKDNPVDNLVVFTRDADTVGLENEWHSDGTFREVPPMGTVLRAVEVPPLGDTLYADMAAAYDNLPQEIKDQIDGLMALHDWSLGKYADKYGDRLEEFRRIVPPVEQPVVMSHPRTGRKTLFVNRLFTKSINGLDPDESDRLLDLLCRQAEVPEYQCRHRWQPGSIAFWDNLGVQHYGASDYYPQRRVMARAAIAGTTKPRAPVGHGQPV
ncbi:MAG TPA: TauD/TfdA family dioxygenase [Acidimicrobiales bacterium]|jgi:taurine dioxygenase